MRNVIAIAAPIGGGKTSLVTALADTLGDSVTVHFDHYEKLTGKPVEHLLGWMKRGADFNDFEITGLADDLKKLKRGEDVIDPYTKMKVPSKKYIVFEMPLGKEHRQTAPYIDLLIWIDIPLDVALARKLREFTGDFLNQYDQLRQKDFIIWLDAYLENYLNIVGQVLRIQREKVRAGADIIMDGTGEPGAIIRQVIEDVRARTVKEEKVKR